MRRCVTHRLPRLPGLAGQIPLAPRAFGSTSSSPRASTVAGWLVGLLASTLLVGISPDPTRAQDSPAPGAGATNEAAPGSETVDDPARRPSAVAQFTTEIENREPIDSVTFVSNDTRRIFLFSDLRNLEGRTVTHRWIYSGRTVAEVDFEVRGPRWRVWSSKDLLSGWVGDWTVEIVTDSGEVIAAETFTYSAAGT